MPGYQSNPNELLWGQALDDAASTGDYTVAHAIELNERLRKEELKNAEQAKYEGIWEDIKFIALSDITNITSDDVKFLVNLRKDISEEEETIILAIDCMLSDIFQQRPDLTESTAGFSPRELLEQRRAYVVGFLVDCPPEKKSKYIAELAAIDELLMDPDASWQEHITAQQALGRMAQVASAI